jgi:hypothetical protein
MNCFVEERSPLMLGARKLTTISFCEEMGNFLLYGGTLPQRIRNWIFQKLLTREL